MILIDNAKVICDSNQRNCNCKSEQRLLMHWVEMKLAFISIITWEQREIIVSFKDDASENNALRNYLKNNLDQGQCVLLFFPLFFFGSKIISTNCFYLVSPKWAERVTTSNSGSTKKLCTFALPAQKSASYSQTTCNKV